MTERGTDPKDERRSGYRLAWRRLRERIDGSRILVVESERAADADCLLRVARERKGDALAGEFRIDWDLGRRVYTSIAQIEAWDLSAGTMPEAAVHSLWANEVRRAAIVSEMLARLRAAFSRAVAAGIVHEAAAASIVRIAERAAADPDAIVR